MTGVEKQFNLPGGEPFIQRMGHFDLLLQDASDNEEQVKQEVEMVAEEPLAAVVKPTVVDDGNGWEQQTHRHSRKSSNPKSTSVEKASEKPVLEKPSVNFERSTTAHGQTVIRRPRQPPLQVSELNSHLTIELYAFPTTHRTGNLKALLQAHDGHYRLKWHHDSSAWVHFDSPDLAKQVLSSWTDELVKVRPFDPVNVVQKEESSQAE